MPGAYPFHTSGPYDWADNDTDTVQWTPLDTNRHSDIFRYN